MEEREGKPAISVEVGLKAGLEVKAEIPEKSVGRLVDSLTDIIRPFTETRGLRADQIRLQREDILIEIAKKARARAELERISVKPIPIKMLVPFLEKASAEDMDTEMHDRWAALLLSASNEFHSRHLTFLDILGRLSSAEIKILERVAFSYKAFPETYYPGGHIEENRSSVEGGLHKLIVPPTPVEDTRDASEIARKTYERFVTETNVIYGEIMHASVKKIGGGRSYFYAEGLGWSGSRFGSLEILQREKLIEIERIKMAQLEVEAAYFNLTFLGVAFVRDCSPDARRMAARRPPPIPVTP